VLALCTPDLFHFFEVEVVLYSAQEKIPGIASNANHVFFNTSNEGLQETTKEVIYNE